MVFFQYFPRTFQDSSVYSSTFQACANPGVDALCPSQQMFSHLGMISCLPGLNQHKAADKVSCSVCTYNIIYEYKVE